MTEGSSEAGYLEYILHARQNDRQLRTDVMGIFYRNRSGQEYIRQLMGLAGYLNYAKTIAPDKTVLDLGTGSGRGLKEIWLSPFGQGLNFKGTGIIQDEAAKTNLGKENYIVTSAPNLTNIPDSSVSAIICLNGDINALMSTKFMGVVARRIDEVLIPGGALKFNVNVYNEQLDSDESSRRNINLDTFISHLKSKGFDIAIKEAENEGPEIRVDLIVLGIKGQPEKSPIVKAETLLNQDYNTLKDQIEFYKLRQGSENV